MRHKGDDGRCLGPAQRPLTRGAQLTSVADEFVAELVPLHFNFSAPRLDTMFFRRVQQLSKFGVRYAAEFSGKARVISRPGTRATRNPPNKAPRSPLNFSHQSPRPRNSQELGIQTCVEATACGLFFATWWRYSHTQEKIRYDKYYAMLRAEQAALAEE